MPSSFMEQAMQQGFVSQVLRELAPKHARIIPRQFRQHEVSQGAPPWAMIVFKATHVDGVDEPLLVYPIPDRPRYESLPMWKERVEREIRLMWDESQRRNNKIHAEDAPESPPDVGSTPPNGGKVDAVYTDSPAVSSPAESVGRKTTLKLPKRA